MKTLGNLPFLSIVFLCSLQGIKSNSEHLEMRKKFYTDVYQRHMSGGDLEVRYVIVLCNHDDLDLCNFIQENMVMSQLTLSISVWTELDITFFMEEEEVEMTLFIVVSPDVLLRQPTAIKYSEKNMWYIPTELENQLPIQLLRLTSKVALYDPLPSPEEGFEISEVYRVKEKVIRAKRGKWLKDTGFAFKDIYIWERRKNLQGVHFNTAVESNPPTSNVTVNENGEVTGIQGMFPDIFHGFQKQFNFTYDMVVAPGRVWGSKSLVTNEWNGKLRGEKGGIIIL